MGSAQSVLTAALAAFLALRGDCGENDGLVEERYRALTAAFSRAEFDGAEAVAQDLVARDPDSIVARKAASLARLASFLRDPRAEAPPGSGVVATAGALRLSLAPDLAFAAAAVGERGLRPLLFGHPAPFTSRVTVWADGEAFAPSRPAALGSGPGIVEGRITERDVEVVVRMYGGAAPSWHPAAEQATVRVEVVLTNRGAAPRTLGARVLLDVVDGFDDAPLARVGIGPVEWLATEWIGDAVPRRLSLHSRSFVLRGIGAPAPERALLVPLAVAESSAFDFALPRDLPLGSDSALVLYAEPRLLAPGESRTVVCESTPDADEVDAARPVGAAIFQEPVAGDPRATRVLLLLRGGARGTIGDPTAVAVTPRIGGGLETISLSPDFGALGTLPRDLTVQRSLVVRPDLSRGGASEVAFDVAADLDGAGVRGRDSRRVATSVAIPGAVELAGRIVDPRGSPVPDCEIVVRQGGREVARGRSDGAGNYSFAGLAPAPCEVLAQRVVYAEPAAKAARESVDGLLLDVLLTSETIDDAGNHRLPVVTPGGGRDIVLARSLTRYSLLVVVEWDAPRSYLEGLARGMRKAAEFLYGASDGHFTFGRVAIRDCGRDWNHADLWDWANNSVHPNASVAGIRHRYHPRFAPWNTAINFGRQWDSSWEGGGLYTTVVHEFGHYGFGLFDEYLGAPQGAYRNLSYPEMCRCIMGYQYSDHKICWSANHRTYTNQGMFNGRSCWEQLEANHEGDRGGFFAAVTTPAERNGVTPPPVANRIGDAVRIVIDDGSTNGRDVPLEIVGPFGRAPAGVPVYTESSVENRTVYHGVTNGLGQLTLMGVHPGDRVSAAYAGARAELVLDESTRLQRLEFGMEPHDGARATFASFVPDTRSRDGAREFVGGVLELRRPSAEARVVSVAALTPNRHELRFDETADGVGIVGVGLESFRAGRATFELVTSDPRDGDSTILVDVVVGYGEVAAFDGSLAVAAASPDWIAIASTSGPAVVGVDATLVGRMHSIVAAAGAGAATVTAVIPEPRAAGTKLCALDAQSRERTILEVEALEPIASERAAIVLPATLAWVESP